MLDYVRTLAERRCEEMPTVRHAVHLLFVVASRLLLKSDVGGKIPGP